MQRVTRLPLLVQAILKYLPSDHSEHSAWSEVLVQLQKVRNIIHIYNCYMHSSRVVSTSTLYPSSLWLKSWPGNVVSWDKHQSKILTEATTAVSFIPPKSPFKSSSYFPFNRKFSTCGQELLFSNVKVNIQCNNCQLLIMRKCQNEICA